MAKMSQCVSITGIVYAHIVRDGRKKLPDELKAKRVCITLSPQAIQRKKNIKNFSAWVEEKIYTETG